MMVDKEELLKAVDKLLGIRRKVKEKKHTLKWKIPEARLTLPVKDADEIILLLEKKLRMRFTAGGEYSEIVHAKEYGEGVYSYFMVRTDKKTEEETVAADAYMLQEEDTLGFDVTSAFKVVQDLEELGYKEVFTRDYRYWAFKYFELPVKVFDIGGFGEFVEIAIPATNVDVAREKSEKKAMELVGKLGFKEKDAIPADLLTLQLMQTMQGKKR